MIGLLKDYEVSFASDLVGKYGRTLTPDIVFLPSSLPEELHIRLGIKYDTFGPFVFNRKQYEQALKR